jgi:hypothetical protein
MDIFTSKMFWSAVIAGVAVAVLMKFVLKDKLDPTTGKVTTSFIGFGGDNE